MSQPCTSRPSFRQCKLCTSSVTVLETFSCVIARGRAMGPARTSGPCEKSSTAVARMRPSADSATSTPVSASPARAVTGAHQSGCGVCPASSRSASSAAPSTAIALRRGADEATTVRHPVVFVNVGIRRRHEVQLAAALRHDRDPLLVELDADLTARGRPGLERAGALLRRYRREDRELTPVGREARRLGNALDPSEDGQLRATRESELCLTLDRVAADECELSSDRKSARLNSSHLGISYAVFCLK